MGGIRRIASATTALAILVVALSMDAGPARAESCQFTFPAGRPAFPGIPLCVFTGAYQDSSHIAPDRCLGIWAGPLADSVREVPRTVTLRFLRDRVAEANPTFGGYRIYRVINTPDTTRMMLLRRFSRQAGDERTWNFSVVSSDTSNLPGGGRSVALNFRCGGRIVHDSVVTFVDPDSAGNFVKVCRIRRPQEGTRGECVSRGDSVIVLETPPGPHDGFRTWYAITYEARNVSLDATYEDMFVPDTTGALGPCAIPGDKRTCPNLNHKSANIAGPIEPTAGPTPNLEDVYVVPNPFRANEAWERVGTNEIHFINLPKRATILVYTVAGDLVAKIEHDDPVRDFQRWDLKNQDGRDVSSGIYLYRVEADAFDFQDRFIVIR